MGCCENIEKNLLIYINGLFVIIALASIIGGIWIISDDYLIKQLNLTDEFSFVSLVIGIALIVSGILSVILYMAGLWGAVKETSSVLKVYAWILTIGLILSLIQMIMSYNMFDMKQLSFLKHFFKNYNEDKAMTSMVDFIQRTFKCCGYDGPEEFTTAFENYPRSCCDSSSEYCFSPTYTDGCLYRLRDVLTRWQIISCVVTFITSVLNIICIVSAFRLASKIVKRPTSATIYRKM